MGPQAAEKPEEEGADDGPEIEVVSPPDVEVERPPKGEPAEQQAESRKQRRENVVAKAREEAENLRRELSARDERLNRQERETAELRGFLAAQLANQRADPSATPEAKIAALEDEADLHLERAAKFANEKNAEGQKREMRAYNAKLREANVIAARGAIDPGIDSRFQQFQQQQPDREVEQATTAIASEFPDITTNPIFQGAADSIYRTLVAQGRPPKSLATFREAAAGAAKALGIGGRPAAPTNSQKARYGGVPAGEGGGGGREVVRIADDRANRALAAKSFPKLDRAAAWSAFTKMVAESED